MSRRTFHDWFASRAGRQILRRARRRALTAPLRRPLRFEPLEDRRLLAVITVNTTVDENDGVGLGGISLRDAIAAANPGDTIDFSVTGTITLEHGELNVNKSLTIDGPGAKALTIDAAGQSRVFSINDGNNNVLANVLLQDLAITGGVTSDDGGGILSRENLTIVRSVISNNEADDGGGLANFGGRFQIVDSTFHGNVSTDMADGGGGGIFNFSSAVGQTSTISNSTFSDNHAATTGGSSFSNLGGGIYNFLGTLNIEFSTFTLNEAAAGKGSGIASLGDSNAAVTRLHSTIVAGNVNSDIDRVVGLQNSVVSQGYNLYGSGTAAVAFNSSGDKPLIGSLLLGPLADNGGPTPTHAVLPFSPALDAGDSNADAGFGNVPLFDQRGLPFGRVADGNLDGTPRIDIGAFEAAIVFVVDTLSDEDDGIGAGDGTSLRDAIEAANLVGSGTPLIVFDESLTSGGPAVIDLSLGQLEIAGSMSVSGPGGSLLTINAQGVSRIFVVSDQDNFNQIEVTISGLVLTGGFDLNGGGAIFTEERLTVIDSTITGNTAQWGGGLYNATDGELHLVNSTVSGNTATSSGGGLYNYSANAYLTGSVVSGNMAPDAAGIRNISGAYLSIVGSSVTLNTAGGIAGGIHNHASDLVIDDSHIESNSAGDFGGGVLNEEGGFVTITESTISGNSAPNAGGIGNRSYGYLYLYSSTIDGNMAESEGGDFDAGGGILNDNGRLHLVDSTVSGNSADFGAGLYSRGQKYLSVSLIRNSTISGNTATLAGGGLYNFGGHTLIEFSTISNNSANYGGGGLGIWGDLNVTRVEVHSTIIAGNQTSDVDLLGGPTEGPENTIVSNDYNAVDTGTGVSSFDGANDLIVSIQELALGPLADNGGPTKTHRLRPGSVAIDAGDPSAVADENGVPLFDQRGEGFQRVRDGDAAEGIAIDIGAYEVQQFVPGPELPGDYNLDEVVNAADYTVWRDTLGQDVEAYQGADGDGDGKITRDDYSIWKSQYGMSLGEGGGSLATQAIAIAVHPIVGAAVPAVEPESPVESAAVHTEQKTPYAVPLVGAAERASTASSSAAPDAAHTATRDDGLLAWLVSRSGGVNPADKKPEFVSDDVFGEDASLSDSVDAVFAGLDGTASGCRELTI